MSVWLVFCALTTMAAPLAAQGAVTGIVRDDSTGAPIAGVEVLINGTSFRALTDARGRYLIAGVPAGARQAVFRLVGYRPMRTDVLFITGDTTRANALLIRGIVALDEITVTGAPSLPPGAGMGREAFEERRRMGFGRFIDSVEVRRWEQNSLADMVRRAGGVTLQVDPFSRKAFAFHRSRVDGSGRPNCLMQIYYDGAPRGRGGIAGASETDPVDLSSLRLTDIESIEVYRSAAEVPAEFNSTSSGCGVIAIWSRRH